MDKKAILAVSFGTTHHDTLRRTIEVIERELAAEFPDRVFRRAFTSGMVRRRLRERDAVEIDSSAQALERLSREGITDVVIQPTHVIPGEEYEKLLAEAESCRGLFDRMAVGRPLLTELEDYTAAARAILHELPPPEEGTALVFMGHGTAHHVNPAYTQLEYMFHDMGRRDIVIGTVEGYPGLAEVLRRLEEREGIARTVLFPLMIVAGDHAKNDLAGEEPDSWKSVLEERGYTVSCDLRGLGEYPGIRAVLTEHARCASEEMK